MAEDIIIYCSQEFGLLELSDAVSTGSSIMPQKKNADAMELIRGKAGRIFGHHAALLATMKGLPLAYNKDMQEDKEAVFDTADNTRMCLRVASIVMDNLTVNETRSRESAEQGYLNATELADYLVRKGVPFRNAHDTAGKIVLHALEQNKEIGEIDLRALRTFSNKIELDIFQALSLGQTLATKGQIGGTSPARVYEALSKAKRVLKREEKNLQG
jgi:argininosuccinate lyase